MSYSLNQCQFIGNLGRDPEIKQVGQGAKVATFSIACTERWKDDRDQVNEKTEWVSVVAWRKQADLVEQLLAKGSRVYVEGKMQTRSWDGSDGKKQYKTEILLNRFILCGGGREGGGNRQASQDDGWDAARQDAGRRSQERGFGAPPPPADDLPF